MDTDSLKRCLIEGNRQELGIPIVLPSLASNLHEVLKWSVEGQPHEGRQIWFCAANAREIRESLASELRGRILPLSHTLIPAIFQRSPQDALLLSHHGFDYSDPNLTVSPFWRARGFYKVCQGFESPEYKLWFWKPYGKKLKLFGMDHHHAVLWDAKQILRPLGIQLDFFWLCDGRPAVNEVWPSSVPGFKDSLDIYKPPVDMKLSDETKDFIKKGNYDGILTSHSIITSFRLKDLQLPLYHINSTRFGNSWITDPSKHTVLVKWIEDAINQQQLTIIHNNVGDREYLHQYIPSISPNQEIVIPSLCESFARLRTSVPTPPKILIWDTRQVLIKPDTSPFLKNLFVQLRHNHKDLIECQSLLVLQKQGYLPEGYLDNFAAVIHIPYNISTMSMFQHVRANIPIWVPSKRLLKQLLIDNKEPNEMSWTVFAPGSQSIASTMDNVRREDVVERWLEFADFYNANILPLVFQFDSIEELVEKVVKTDYQSYMNKAEEEQQRRRENIIFAWEQVFQKSRVEA